MDWINEIVGFFTALGDLLNKSSQELWFDMLKSMTTNYPDPLTDFSMVTWSTAFTYALVFLALSVVFRIVMTVAFGDIKITGNAIVDIIVINVVGIVGLFVYAHLMRLSATASATIFQAIIPAENKGAENWFLDWLESTGRAIFVAMNPSEIPMRILQGIGLGLMAAHSEWTMSAIFPALVTFMVLLPFWRIAVLNWFIRAILSVALTPLVATPLATFILSIWVASLGLNPMANVMTAQGSTSVIIWVLLLYVAVFFTIIVYLGRIERFQPDKRRERTRAARLQHMDAAGFAAGGSFAGGYGSSQWRAAREAREAVRAERKDASLHKRSIRAGTVGSLAGATATKLAAAHPAAAAVATTVSVTSKAVSSSSSNSLALRRGPGSRLRRPNL